MRARTAALSIEYSEPNMALRQAIGSCTIVDRDHDFYYGWCILTDYPEAALRGYPGARLQLAAVGGSVACEALRPADASFESALEHIITDIERHEPRRPGTFHVVGRAWTPEPKDPVLIEKLVHMLEMARKHPAMCFGEVRIDVLCAFLSGISMGCLLSGYQITHTPDSPFHTLVEARGWPYSARSPAFAMSERGLTELEIIDELLQIEILAWKATYNLDQEGGNSE